SPAGARQDHRPPGVARGAGVRAERARSRHRLAGRAGNARPARANRQPDRLGAGVGAPARPRRLLPRLARSLPAWGAGAERVPRRRGSVRARRLAAGGAALPSRHCLGFELRARAVAAFERAALAPHACPGRCAAPPGASAPRSERARPAAHRGPARALERGAVRPVRHRARSLSRRRLRCVALRGRAPEPRRACGRPPRQRAGCAAARGSGGLLPQAGVRRPGVGWDPAGPGRGRELPANAHEAQAVALVTLGAVGPALAQFDSAAALFGAPEAALEAVEWRVLLGPLGLRVVDAVERQRGVTALERLAGHHRLGARAAWALAFAAQAQGDTLARAQWQATVERRAEADSGAARLAMLLQSAALAGRGQYDRAVRP